MDRTNLNAIVTFRNEISPGLMILQVAPDGWNLPDFVPGQYVALGLPESGATPERLIKRPYSIASSPVNREFLEFYLNLVPGGRLTPLLFNLKIGDRIWLSTKIAGAFTFEHVPEEANVVLVATGSGLAPYVSMLTTHLRFVRQRRLALVHGVRHSCDLGHRSTFMAMEHFRPNFTYLPVISRPQDEPAPWKGATGHVQDLWKSDAIERAWGLRPSAGSTHVFLCGNPEMIHSMIATLAGENFSEHTATRAGQIHVEKYWTIRPDAKESGTELMAG